LNIKTEIYQKTVRLNNLRVVAALAAANAEEKLDRLLRRGTPL
jgi:hypothetical protein